MRAFISVIALGVATALSTAALADGTQNAPSQPVAVAPDPTPPPAPSAKLERVCRLMIHEGMLLKSSTCQTQAQWDEDRRRQEREIEKFQNRSYVH
jgi:hypothetical protein